MRNLLNEDWLFHYTNGEGFLGIIRSGSLWGTDANYLNDYKEIQLGVDYARHWLTQNKAALISKYDNSTVISLDNNMNPTPGRQSGQRMFICSFSTEKDSLPQWRSYASGSGYSLGFHKEYLGKKANELGLALQKCVYEHDFEQNPVADYLDKLNKSDYFKDLNSDKLLDICNGIIRNSIVLKGSAFKEENEWRLFPDFNFHIKSKERQQFRVRNGIFTPYIDLKIFPATDSEKNCKTSENSTCPVLQVMIGPTAHPELARDGLSKLLWNYQNEYTFLSPNHSSASYRDW